jgi:hypothetical protein
MSRPPKKSETLEIRLPHRTKEAFMARCREDGGSASEAVRAFIEAEIAERPAPRRAGLLPRLAAGALLAAAAGAVAAPTLAHPTNRAAEFSRLDRNHDGVLSFEEFNRR